jgi:hypothetical protein
LTSREFDGVILNQLPRHYWQTPKLTKSLDVLSNGESLKVRNVLMTVSQEVTELPQLARRYLIRGVPLALAKLIVQDSSRMMGSPNKGELSGHFQQTSKPSPSRKHVCMREYSIS